MSITVSGQTKQLEFFEGKLFNEEVKYLMRIMPKGYALINSSKSSRIKATRKKTTSTPNRASTSIYPQSTKRIRKNRNPSNELAYQNKAFQKQGTDSRNILKRCKKVLDEIKRHQYAEHFMKPVDPIAQGIPDYPNIIKHPMDLSTIEKKLNSGEYVGLINFASDVRLIWSNALTYNPKNSQFYNMTTIINEDFEKIFKNEIEETNFLEPYPLPKNSTHKVSHSKKEEQGNEMSYQEKKALTEAIKNLSTENLHGVWNIMISINPELGKESELVFDIDKLPLKTVRSLEKFVKSKLKAPTKSKTKRIKATFNPQTGQDTAPKPFLQPKSSYQNGQGAFPTNLPAEDIGGNTLKEDNDRQSKSSDSSFFTDSDDDK